MKHNFNKTALFSALLCLCLAINALESILMHPLVIPFPGVKLGLSNIVILYAISTNEKTLPWILTISKTVFGALLFGSPLTFFFSICGGLFSVSLMLLSKPLINQKFSFFSISIIGSLGFQIGQSLATYLIYGTPVLYYIPILLFFGILSGALLGTIQNILFVRLNKITFN